VAFADFTGCKPATNDESAKAQNTASQTRCASQSHCIDLSGYNSVVLTNVSKVIWLDSNDFYAFPEPLDNFVAAKQKKTNEKGVRFVGGRGKAVITETDSREANDPSWRMPFLPAQRGVSHDSSKPLFHAFRFEHMGKTYWTDAQNIMKNGYGDYWYLSDFLCASGRTGVWVVKNNVMELQCAQYELKPKKAACSAFGSNVCNGK
jgi:hypothetical protein